MPEKATISTAFYMQVATILTIAGASIFGFRYGVSEMERIADEKIKPLVERVQKVEENQKEFSTVLAVNTERIQINYICLNSFLEYYNKAYHKEFLKPADVEETQYKKRR